MGPRPGAYPAGATTSRSRRQAARALGQAPGGRATACPGTHSVRGGAIIRTPFEGELITQVGARGHCEDTRLCPNHAMLSEAPNLNPGPAPAPPAAPSGVGSLPRRRRPLRAEPVIFALLLTLLTLGINLSSAAPEAEQAETQPAPAHLAQAR